MSACFWPTVMPTRRLFLGLSAGLPVFTGIFWSAISGALCSSDFLFRPFGGIFASLVEVEFVLAMRVNLK